VLRLPVPEGSKGKERDQHETEKVLRKEDRIDGRKDGAVLSLVL
jgi:hypothetical protein